MSMHDNGSRFWRNELYDSISRGKYITCIRCIKYSFKELIILTLEGTIPSGRFTVLKITLARSDWRNMQISLFSCAILRKEKTIK